MGTATSAITYLRFVDACHGLTNAGVAKLARLPKLRELRLAGKGLTPDVKGLFPPRITVFYERG
jgi:hypothetical protein